MSENNRLVWFFWDIHDHQVKSIDIDCFKTNDDFFDSLVVVSQHLDIGVANIELIFPLDEETVVSIVWVVLFDFEHKET